MKGFACAKDGVIDIRTVQDSEVGAMVNGLVVYGVGLPMRNIPDDAIRAFFQANLEATGIYCIPVTVAADVN